LHYQLTNDIGSSRPTRGMVSNLLQIDSGLEN